MRFQFAFAPALLASFTISAMFAVTLAAPSMAQASATCTLPPSQVDDVYSDLGEPVRVTLTTTLTQAEAAQVIATANIFATSWGETIAPTVEAAIAYLMDASESEDLYIFKPTINGVAYTFVEHFPGGNPYGVFFLGDTNVEIAQMHDSDVVCSL